MSSQEKEVGFHEFRLHLKCLKGFKILRLKKVICILGFFLFFNVIYSQEQDTIKDIKHFYYEVTQQYTSIDSFNVELSKHGDSRRKQILDSIVKLVSDSIKYNYLKSDSTAREVSLQPASVLIKKKNKTIQELEEALSFSQILAYSLIAISCFALILFTFQYRRRKQLKKRFDEVIKNNQQVSEIEKEKPQAKEELDIPQNVRDKIIVGLENFENNYHFIDSDMKLSSLAVMLDTNSNYLSKMINHHKRMNYSSYINELRINYTLKLLDNDSKIRRYSIKGIAQEVGYNSAESFSNAFYKKTGLKPSYYIKQLGKMDS